MGMAVRPVSLQKHTEVRERTTGYICQYLDPYLWSMEASWDDITDTRGVDESEVAHIIRQMRYEDFLQTPYWRAISKHIKRQAGGECEFCGKAVGLKAHHISYAHHGWEHRHREDLRCMCEQCHEECHRRQSDLTA